MLSITPYRQESGFHEMLLWRGWGLVLLTAAPSCRVRDKALLSLSMEVLQVPPFAYCHTIVSEF